MHCYQAFYTQYIRDQLTTAVTVNSNIAARRIEVFLSCSTEACREASAATTDYNFSFVRRPRLVEGGVSRPLCELNTKQTTRTQAPLLHMNTWVVNCRGLISSHLDTKWSWSSF